MTNILGILADIFAKVVALCALVCDSVSGSSGDMVLRPLADFGHEAVSVDGERVYLVAVLAFNSLESSLSLNSGELPDY